jgi:hypothetical protein
LSFAFANLLAKSIRLLWPIYLTGIMTTTRGTELNVYDHRKAMADKLARMAQQLTLAVGQTKRFSREDTRVLELIGLMAEICDLYECEPLE